MLQSKSNWKYWIPENVEETSLEDINGLSPIVKQLLIQRGLTSTKEINQFLSPDIKNLYNPNLLSSIERATERVHQAIANKEKILIFGDYDADGVSSTTVMLKTLQELGAVCDYYIPNRFTEGYGPNEQAFIEASKNGFSLIITVDTGIAAVHEAEVARNLGIDLIITDHHEVQHEIPDAFAIIHPKCSPDYPFNELAGVGVAFKFAESLLGYFPKHLLEFVAIGTIADLVPLVKENRILSYYGLHALTISKNHGINALKRVCKLEGSITEEDVGFSIGPRINAVGRLQDAELAVQLLMTEDPDEAEEIALEVQGINEQRQQIVNDIVKEAEAMIDQDHDGVIVVAKEGWNEGVLGIVASRLVKKYDRPAIVLTIKRDQQEAKGSARSIPAFDFFHYGMKIRELFTHFGGHSQAAGMTLPIENISQIRDKLSEYMHTDLSEEDFKQEIVISECLSIEEISIEMVNDLTRLAPFGMQNPKPIFQLKEIPAEVRQIGSMKNHLKIQFANSQARLDGIGFGLGELYPYLTPKTPISVVGELGINEWNGIKKVQILIQDMKIEERQVFDERGKKRIEVLSYPNQRILYISHEKPEHSMDKDWVNYEMNISELPKADVLYIYDLPKRVEELRQVIQQTQPTNIHACYTVEESAYLTTFPKREEFVWFYALVKKRKKVDLTREIASIQKTKGWTREKVIFISQVFFELGFVTITNGVISLNPNPDKRDLSDSIIYRERLNKMELEKVLYYSNYDDLKRWFNNCIMEKDSPKEELANGS
ncbi:single-stranded-DNA-specific exonuclease RecJ [Oceanobacillus piezotolerans]|uniref:Single-stranded-DNA-specific exonuclease RecJ n=1 Tax=Oceanobacillus piezotolerans TaxID=2448030 RepID=A0A498DSS8_9BACI|nr:single-stranded-DNA-specific exonuclease RecJ [Oceanobacillus piezotolerans]RLL47987.1 single-stranded-DNA-specific exonuclease RecJ [Oceanobacillus piezotolerans]